MYYNDKRLSVSLELEFRNMWTALAIPDPAELANELEKGMLSNTAGLKPARQVRDVVAPKQKQKTRRKTRFRLTNTHLQGVDLTQDFDL